MGAHGPNFSGIHHFGFEVEDLDQACDQLEQARAQRLSAKDGVDAAMAGGGHANFEMKWSGPDGVVLDISHTGWEGTHEAEMPLTQSSPRKRGASTQAEGWQS